MAAMTGRALDKIENVKYIQTSCCFALYSLARRHSSAPKMRKTPVRVAIQSSERHAMQSTRLAVKSHILFSHTANTLAACTRHVITNKHICRAFLDVPLRFFLVLYGALRALPDFGGTLDQILELCE